MKPHTYICLTTNLHILNLRIVASSAKAHAHRRDSPSCRATRCEYIIYHWDIIPSKVTVELALLDQTVSRNRINIVRNVDILTGQTFWYSSAPSFRFCSLHISPISVVDLSHNYIIVVGFCFFYEICKFSTLQCSNRCRDIIFSSTFFLLHFFKGTFTLSFYTLPCLP